MENKYQNLMQNIPVPARLTERVLAAARVETAGENLPARRKTHHSILRAALCAAAALALFAGVVPLRAAGHGNTYDPGQAAVPVPLSFGLTAYAASLDASYPACVDGSLAMGSGSGMYWEERNGFFTGSLFQVAGENIQTISLSLDRGAFYSYRMLDGLTQTQTQEIREAQARGEIAPAAIDQDSDGAWSFQEMIPLENTVTAAYDEDIWYGLWISGGYSGGDMQTACQSSTDALDGGQLTVTVTFADGTEQTSRYRLHTGKLRVSGQFPLPEPAGEDEAYIYGVYAVPEP